MATFYSTVKYTEEGSYEVYHIIKQKTSASKRLFQKQQTGKIVGDPPDIWRGRRLFWTFWKFWELNTFFSKIPKDLKMVRPESSTVFAKNVFFLPGCIKCLHGCKGLEKFL